MTDARVFGATEVQAKHDENYMPPGAAKAVGDAHARAAEKKTAERGAALQPPTSPPWELLSMIPELGIFR